LSKFSARRLESIESTRQSLGGVTRKHIYDLINRGELESVKAGRRRFILPDSTDAYVARLVEQEDERRRLALALVERTTEAQGLSRLVTDTTVLAQVAAVIASQTPRLIGERRETT
jgi:hypothetical protein